MLLINLIENLILNDSIEPNFEQLWLFLNNFFAVSYKSGFRSAYKLNWKIAEINRSLVWISNTTWVCSAMEDPGRPASQSADEWWAGRDSAGPTIRGPCRHARRPPAGKMFPVLRKRPPDGFRFRKTAETALPEKGSALQLDIPYGWRAEFPGCCSNRRALVESWRGHLWWIDPGRGMLCTFRPGWKRCCAWFGTDSAGFPIQRGPHQSHKCRQDLDHFWNNFQTQLC